MSKFRYQKTRFLICFIYLLNILLLRFAVACLIEALPVKLDPVLSTTYLFTITCVFL